MVGFLVSLCFSLVTNYTLGSNYFVTMVTKPRHPDQPQTKAAPNNGNNVTATVMGQETHGELVQEAATMACNKENKKNGQRDIEDASWAVSKFYSHILLLLTTFFRY
jgi:hypothetical protein